MLLSYRLVWHVPCRVKSSELVRCSQAYAHRHQNLYGYEQKTPPHSSQIAMVITVGTRCPTPPAPQTSHPTVNTSSTQSSMSQSRHPTHDHDHGTSIGAGETTTPTPPRLFAPARGKRDRHRAYVPCAIGSVRRSHDPMLVRPSEGTFPGFFRSFLIFGDCAAGKG